MTIQYNDREPKKVSLVVSCCFLCGSNRNIVLASCSVFHLLQLKRDRKLFVFIDNRAPAECSTLCTQMQKTKWKATCSFSLHRISSRLCLCVVVVLELKMICSYINSVQRLDIFLLILCSHMFATKCNFFSQIVDRWLNCQYFMNACISFSFSFLFGLFKGKKRKKKYYFN